MLYLRTGLPGASKTLNTIKEIVENSMYDGWEVYYHNIKLLMLDLDVVYSFAGFFYGELYPSLDEHKKEKYLKILKRIHQREDLASLDDFPFLTAQYHAYSESERPLELFLKWVRLLYPKSRLKPFDEFLELKGDEPLTKEVIKTFNLDWRHFEDPTKWVDLSGGSVLILDECQDYFQPMSANAKRPEHLTMFAKHRHKGIDVYMITQNEKFIDKFPRDLAHRHVHYFNKFGGEQVHRIESPKTFDTKDESKVNNLPAEVIRRDKRYYGVYWSADVHTHKFKLPKKIIRMMVIAVLGLSMFVYGVYNFSLHAFGDDEAEGSQLINEPVSSITGPVVEPRNVQQVKQKKYFFEENATDFSHPLAVRCIKLNYAGFEKIRRKGGFEVIHYFSCVSNETVTYNAAGESSGDNESASDSQRTINKSRLVAFDMLEKLGYSVDFDGRFLILSYGDAQILYERSI